MHDSRSIKASINRCYSNANASHASVMALYVGGLLEARRVLHKGGILFLKTQAEIEGGKQRLTHVELCTILPILGFEIVDEFVLHQRGVPAVPQKEQQYARKNHSFLIVAR